MCDVRILRARSARASQGRRERKNGIFSVSPQSRSLFSASFQTFCLTARAYLNTQKYGLFCSLLPYISYIGMCHPIGQGFCPFWSESGMVFEGTTGMHERFLSCQFQMSIRKKEREVCEFEMDLKNFFVCALI